MCVREIENERERVRERESETSKREREKRRRKRRVFIDCQQGKVGKHNALSGNTTQGTRAQYATTKIQGLGTRGDVPRDRLLELALHDGFEKCVLGFRD